MEWTTLAERLFGANHGLRADDGERPAVELDFAGNEVAVGTRPSACSSPWPRRRSCWTRWRSTPAAPSCC
jgi:hypothetical protein